MGIEALLGFASVVGRSPTVVVANTSTASVGTWTPDTALNGTNLRRTSSGAMTANTYKEIVGVTGAGVLNFAGVNTVDSTSRVVSIKIVIDGVNVIERSVSTGATNAGPVVIGSYGTDVTFDQVPFNTSLSIQIKSSLSETDKLAAYYMYRVV